jgi:hypothetical protein
MKTKVDFEFLLKASGLSSEAIGELWKWYDSSDRRGAASF